MRIVASFVLLAAAVSANTRISNAQAKLSLFQCDEAQTIFHTSIDDFDVDFTEVNLLAKPTEITPKAHAVVATSQYLVYQSSATAGQQDTVAGTPVNTGGNDQVTFVLKGLHFNTGNLNYQQIAAQSFYNNNVVMPLTDSTTEAAGNYVAADKQLTKTLTFATNNAGGVAVNQDISTAATPMEFILAPVVDNMWYSQCGMTLKWAFNTGAAPAASLVTSAGAATYNCACKIQSNVTLTTANLAPAAGTADFATFSIGTGAACTDNLLSKFITIDWAQVASGATAKTTPTTAQLTLSTTANAFEATMNSATVNSGVYAGGFKGMTFDIDADADTAALIQASDIKIKHVTAGSYVQQATGVLYVRLLGSNAILAAAATGITSANYVLNGDDWKMIGTASQIAAATPSSASITASAFAALVVAALNM